MDDFTLERLSAKPAKLEPKFNKNVFEYHATVSSSIAKITVDCLTSDTGASWCVKVGAMTATVRLCIRLSSKSNSKSNAIPARHYTYRIDIIHSTVHSSTDNI